MQFFQHGPYRDVVYYCWGQHWDSTLRRFDVQRDGNVGLRLRLKVYFRPIDMASGPQTGYYQSEDDRWNMWQWDRFLWNSWRNEFKCATEQFWEEKFWLQPPED